MESQTRVVHTAMLPEFLTGTTKKRRKRWKMNNKRKKKEFVVVVKKCHIHAHTCINAEGIIVILPINPLS